MHRCTLGALFAAADLSSCLAVHAGILTLCTSSQGLLTTASKSADGTYSYNFATVPFLAEALKFFISAWLFRRQARQTPDAAQITRTWESVMLFPVPSIIYWIHNNVQVSDPLSAASTRTPIWMPSAPSLSAWTAVWAPRQRQLVKIATTTATSVAAPILAVSRAHLSPHAPVQFMTLRYVDPATYQILGNLKIVTTGILFRLFLQRRLSLLQWIALALLMIGATTSQVGQADRGCIHQFRQALARSNLCSTWPQEVANHAG